MFFSQAGRGGVALKSLGCWTGPSPRLLGVRARAPPGSKSSDSSNSFHQHFIFPGDIKRMKLSKALKALTSTVFALAAFFALTALMPLAASAQTVTLSPLSATNPLNAQHTVTAQVTGVCAETTAEVDSDGEGTACTSDADCLALDTPGASDEFCDFSGVQGLPIGFLVTGVNPQDNNMAGVVGPNGQATFQYTGVNLGVDTIQACLDTIPEGDDTTTSGCLTDALSFSEDVASNQVTKTWLSVVGTVVLSPLTAVNPDNPAPAKHTVTAQVTGIERCAGGSGNDGTLCSNDADCTGGDTCSDPSGVTVGFEIVSGPNAGDKGWTKTDSTGAATLNYTSNSIAGVDTIQACLDGDPSSPGVPDENTPLVSECIADSIGGGEPDFASNQAEKRWDPTLKLENLDLGATLVMGTPVYTTNPAYNPVGSTHTVRATIVGAASICFNTVTVSGSRTACKLATDCATGETCGIAGYPVFFSVLAGSQNPGDLSGFVNTDSNGVATMTLSDPNLAGVDTIQACVDADVSEGIPDDTSFTQCINDYQAGATTGQADIPSNTVVKN